MSGAGVWRVVSFVFCASVAMSCGESDETSTVRIGGTVSGLEGSGLVLDSGVEQLSISANGSFTFAKRVERGSAYDVRVATQPTNPDQVCTVAGGTGNANDSTITSVVVMCGAAVYIQGNVAGLRSSNLVLELDGEALAITADGAFTFPRALAEGASFSVKVAVQPSGPPQACFVQNGNGVADVASPPLHVICSAPLGTLRTYRLRTAYVKPDGTLWAWGHNQGLLGDGTVDHRPVAVQLGNATNWQSVDVDTAGGCATRSDGTLWCWGFSDGVVPIAVTQPKLAPVQIGLDTNWVAVATGGYHACGLRTNGSLWCWGDDRSGQLGIGAPALEQMHPVQVGTATDWVSVSAGGSHTCAMKIDDTAWCWGHNIVGAVGDGSDVHRSTPVQIGTSWKSISAGSTHTCAIKPDGTLWCWGQNESGQLGLGTQTFSENAPVQVGTDTTWTSVTAGPFATCATRTDGSAWCWGDNSWGALGDGTSTRRTSPARVLGTQAWASVSPGGIGTCGLEGASGVWCWGENEDGLLGLGTKGERAVPAPVAGTQTWQTVAAYGTATCAIASDETLWCWGNDGFGPDVYNHEVPTQVGSASWKDVTLGGHTCGIQTNGTLWCWGLNIYGALGIGTTSSTAIKSPVQVGTASDWTNVVAAPNLTCARKSNGTIWCWGLGGRVGDGTTMQRTSPVQIGTDTDWDSIAAGGGRACAIKSSGALWCWGDNTFAALGDGTSTSRYAPVQIGTSTTWAHVALGGAHGCGLATDNSLWCWGSNESGALGRLGTSSSTPGQIGTITTWSRIAAGQASSTCATRTDNTLWCWGANHEGQVGDGTRTNKFAPTQIGGAGAGVGPMAIGSAHSCAIGLSGTLSCTGSNTNGVLGDAQGWQEQPAQVSL